MQRFDKLLAAIAMLLADYKVRQSFEVASQSNKLVLPGSGCCFQPL